MPNETKPKSALFALRAVIAFVLLGMLLAVLYWWGFHSYRDVAEWAEPGNHDALVYDGETYYRSGVIGKRGLTLKKYPIDQILGEVKDDGIPVTTEPVTLPETEEETDPVDTETAEETEPVTELESVIPPPGASLFDEKKHAYVLYSVKDSEEFLLLLDKDGEYYLFYREGTQDPLAPDKTDE